jgi:hypothetical protein
MAITYTELKQAITDYTENTETLFVANLDRFIQTAEERIVRETQLEVFRKNASVSITSGNSVVPKPADYLSAYSFSIIDAHETLFLEQKELSFLQSYWPDTSRTGVPRYYANYDVDNFYVAATPRENYTGSLQYFAFPTSIVTSETSWLGNNASMPLLYGAVIEAYIFMKGEADLIQEYEKKYMAAISRVKNFGDSLEQDDEYKRGVIRRPRQ